MTRIRKKSSYKTGGTHSSKKSSSKKTLPLVEVTGVPRGAGANELSLIAMNNEVPFCRVTSLKAKENVERVLLNNRISYYVKWKEQSFFSRLFGGKESVVFVIYIHDTMVDKARSLLKGMKGLKMYGKK